MTDSRFILSLFLPFVFVASRLVLALGKDRTFMVAVRRLSFTQSFAGILIGLALIDVTYNVLHICGLIA